MSHIVNYQDVGLKSTPCDLVAKVLRYVDLYDSAAKIYLCASHMDLAERVERDPQTMTGVDTVALILPPEWANGTINAQAEKVASIAKERGKRVLLVGIDRKRLSPQVSAMADWLIY